MPGNEVGDRVHNFFEQGSLSQDQRHNQVLEGNWSAINNNIWSGNERQIGGPLSSSSKNYYVQQSEVERGQGNQFSLNPHGLNLPQSNLRSDFVKNPTQLQQLNLGGVSQFVHTRQNTEPDRHNLTSRGLSSLESQQRSGLQHANLGGFGGSESPMNFNFLGGQQQMGGQQQGLLQSFPRQQSSISDAQLFQQQVILKQMQEMQRHNQQLQQFEAMQRNAMGQIPNFPSQMGGQHLPVVNGNPFHDAPNYPWQSQVMAGNSNWPQSGLSAMQGYSNGPMITPEQGQALHFMGVIPQQASQSLYGVPVSNSRNANPLSQNNADKPGVLQLSAPASSFSGNQYASPVEKVGMQDVSTVSRSGSEGRVHFEHTSVQSFQNVVSPGSFNQMQQRNASMSEGGREDSTGGSELLAEKSVTQATSQSAVGLDPTEEKILFGNDDNIWEAFGGPSLTGGSNRLDGADLFNGFPSVQSGTWSALMQSAVAETSSSDVGIQEEWSGLGSQSSRAQSGNQHPSAFNENEKQPVWVDSSQRASFGHRTSSNDGNIPNDLNSTGLPKPSPRSSVGAFQTETEMSQEGMKWLDRNQPKQHVEQSRALDKGTSRDFSKTDNVFWSHQQRSLSHDNSGKPCLNFMESGPTNGGVTSCNQDDFRDQEQSRHIHMGAGHGGAMRFEALPTSMDEAATHNLSNMKGNTISSQKLPDNHIDLWKPVNSSVNSGNSGSGNGQTNLNNGPPILESSVVISDGGAVEMHAAENGDRNSSDSHRSGIPSHMASGGLRENLWSDAGDPSGWPAGKEKPVTRKFQYHPMGDVDMDLESTYASKQALHSQPMAQHISSGVKSQETQPRIFGPQSSNSTDMEKGRDVHGATKMPHMIEPSGIHPGYFPNTSAPFGRSGEFSSTNQHMSSQNMLELLHKVDQSMDQNVASIGAAGVNQTQSSTPHGFSLQLAPPSQRDTPSNLHLASQVSSRSIDSPGSDHMTSNKGDKAHAWLSAASSQMLSGNNRPGILGSMDVDGSQNYKGKFSAPLSSGSSYLRNPLQNQHMTAAGGNIVTDQSAALSIDRQAHHDHQSSNSLGQAAASQSMSNLHENVASGRYMNQSGMRALMNQSIMPGMLRKDNLSPLGANQWTSQQQLWGTQAHNTSHLRNSQFPPNGTLEKSSLTQPKKDEQDGARTSSQGIAEPQAAEALSSGRITGASQEEYVMRHPSDASPSNTAASPKDRVTDPTQRESKRLKGPDVGPDTQTAQPLSGGTSNIVNDASISQTSISSDNRNASSQFPHGNVASQVMPQKFVAGSGISRAEHGGISPQMAPSWFEQYGAFKNGQLLTAHNVPRVPVTKNVEQLLISGRSPNNLVIHSPAQQLNVAADNNLIGDICQTTQVEHDSDGLVPHASMPTVASLRPKKRKTATSDLLPWNKEIGQSLKRLQNICSAEVNWAQSSNRLAEKVEHETDPFEDVPPAVRSKRRLILTTQLMQQVFQPPSAAVLSLYASSNYEVIVFSLARLAIGDACSLTCGTKSDLPVHPDSDKPPEKASTSERIRDQYFAKVVENLSNRAQELENDLTRLDKRASILDFRLDCQDLERFAVINRFARFHGRSQVDTADTSSSSDASAAPPRPCPQRYVSAHPMPRTVPERVQCLSL